MSLLLPTAGQRDVSFFLHNHLRFNILYNRDAATDTSRIVGFEVEAFSVKHTYEGSWDTALPSLSTCNPNRMVAVSHAQPPQLVAAGEEVIFTYDVKFTVRTRMWWRRGVRHAHKRVRTHMYESTTTHTQQHMLVI